MINYVLDMVYVIVAFLNESMQVPTTKMCFKHFPLIGSMYIYRVYESQLRVLRARIT